MFLQKPWWDALIVLLVILLFFGPKRLPALGKSLGHGMREFKDGITGKSKSDDEDDRPALTEASAANPAATVSPADPATTVSPAEPATTPEPAAATSTGPESAPVASSEHRS